jgi:O-antigen/teichoic acid export membrane protein
MAAALVPINALTRLYASIMQGFHHIARSQVPEQLLRQLLFLVFIGVAAIVVLGRLSVSLIMLLRIAASLIVLGISTAMTLRILPRQLRHTRPHYGDARQWARIIPPMLWLGIIDVILARADFLLLVPLRNAGDVALYGTAYVLAQFISMVLMAASQSLAPSFAQIHASGDMRRLQRVVAKSTRGIVFASTPATVLLILFGKSALRIYGTDYARASTALVILVVGQYFNALTGPSASLLIMTGHERSTAVGRTIGAIANVTLNLLLIPTWGIEGAAVANTVSLIAWNSILALFSWQRLGIHCTIFEDIWLWRKS